MRTPRRHHLLAAALALLARGLPAALPTVRVEGPVERGTGGSFTLAGVGRLEGRRTFFKSSRGTRGTRYANFESDVVARALFERVGVHAPRAALVHLDEASPLRADLGAVVLAMEFVSPRLAGGRLFHGHFPQAGQADLDEFADMLAVDVLIGNADRRGANFFVARRYGTAEDEPGRARPIPIDNNAGLGTMVNWASPTSLTNFLPTYQGIGEMEVLRDLGTIRNIVHDAPTHRILLGLPEHRPVVRARAARVVARLDDAFLTQVAARLPREILPSGVVVDPAAPELEWLRSRLPAADLAALFPMEAPLRGAALFEYRKREILETLRWRRDHLLEALEEYWQRFDTDPAEQESWADFKAWNRLD